MTAVVKSLIKVMFIITTFDLWVKEHILVSMHYVCTYVCSETVLELKILSSVKGIIVRHDPNLLFMGKVKCGD